jgi:hypothetical protein
MPLPVVVHWRRSALLLRVIVSIHIAALVGVVLAVRDLPLVFFVAALTVIGSAVLAIRAWRLSVGDLRLHGDGRCDFRWFADQDFREAPLLWSSCRLGIVVVSIGADARQRRNLVSATDSLSADDERRVRLWLSCCASGVAEGPDRESG